jgi:hypothetical protein
VTPSAISSAIWPMRAARLVSVTRRNRSAIYRLAEGGLRDLVQCLERLEPGDGPAARDAGIGPRAAGPDAG